MGTSFVHLLAAALIWSRNRSMLPLWRRRYLLLALALWWLTLPILLALLITLLVASRQLQ